MIHHTCELCGGLVKFAGDGSGESACASCGQVHCLDYGTHVYPLLGDDQKLVLLAMAQGIIAVVNGQLEVTGQMHLKCDQPQRSARLT